MFAGYMKYLVLYPGKIVSDSASSALSPFFTFIHSFNQILAKFPKDAKHCGQTLGAQGKKTYSQHLSSWSSRKGTTGDPVAGPSEEGTLADFQKGHSTVQGLEQGQEAYLLVEVQLRGLVLARGHRKPPKGVKQGPTILDLPG